MTGGTDLLVRDTIMQPSSEIGQSAGRFAAGMSSRHHNFGVSTLIGSSPLLDVLDGRWSIRSPLDGIEVFGIDLIDAVARDYSFRPGYDEVYHSAWPFVIPVDPLEAPGGLNVEQVRRSRRAQRLRPISTSQTTEPSLTPNALERWRDLDGETLSPYPAAMGRAGAIDSTMLRFPQARARVERPEHRADTVVVDDGSVYDWSVGSGFAPAARVAEQTIDSIVDRLAPQAPLPVSTWLIADSNALDAPSIAPASQSNLYQRLAGRKANARPGRWQPINRQWVTALAAPERATGPILPDWADEEMGEGSVFEPLFKPLSVATPTESEFLLDTERTLVERISDRGMTTNQTVMEQTRALARSLMDRKTSSKDSPIKRGLPQERVIRGPRSLTIPPLVKTALTKWNVSSDSAQPSLVSQQNTGRLRTAESSVGLLRPENIYQLIGSKSGTGLKSNSQLPLSGFEHLARVGERLAIGQHMKRQQPSRLRNTPFMARARSGQPEIGRDSQYLSRSQRWFSAAPHTQNNLNFGQPATQVRGGSARSHLFDFDQNRIFLARQISQVAGTINQIGNRPASSIIGAEKGRPQRVEALPTAAKVSLPPLVAHKTQQTWLRAITPRLPHKKWNRFTESMSDAHQIKEISGNAQKGFTPGAHQSAERADLASIVMAAVGLGPDSLLSRIFDRKRMRPSSGSSSIRGLPPMVAAALLSEGVPLGSVSMAPQFGLGSGAIRVGQYAHPELSLLHAIPSVQATENTDFLHNLSRLQPEASHAQGSIITPHVFVDGGSSELIQAGKSPWVPKSIMLTLNGLRALIDSSVEAPVNTPFAQALNARLGGVVDTPMESSVVLGLRRMLSQAGGISSKTTSVRLPRAVERWLDAQEIDARPLDLVSDTPRTLLHSLTSETSLAGANEQARSISGSEEPSTPWSMRETRQISAAKTDAWAEALQSRNNVEAWLSTSLDPLAESQKGPQLWLASDPLGVFVQTMASPHARGEVSINQRLNTSVGNSNTASLQRHDSRGLARGGRYQANRFSRYHTRTPLHGVTRRTIDFTDRWMPETAGLPSIRQNWKGVGIRSRTQVGQPRQRGMRTPVHRGTRAPIKHSLGARRRGVAKRILSLLEAYDAVQTAALKNPSQFERSGMRSFAEAGSLLIGQSERVQSAAGVVSTDRVSSISSQVPGSVGHSALAVEGLIRKRTLSMLHGATASSSTRTFNVGDLNGALLSTSRTRVALDSAQKNHSPYRKSVWPRIASPAALSGQSGSVDRWAGRAEFEPRQFSTFVDERMPAFIQAWASSDDGRSIATSDRRRRSSQSYQVAQGAMVGATSTAAGDLAIKARSVFDRPKLAPVSIAKALATHDELAAKVVGSRIAEGPAGSLALPAARVAESVGSLVEPNERARFGVVRRPSSKPAKIEGQLFGDRGPQKVTAPDKRQIVVQTGARQAEQALRSTPGERPTRKAETSEEARHRNAEQSGGSLSPEEIEKIARFALEQVRLEYEFDATRLGMGEEGWD